MTTHIRRAMTAAAVSILFGTFSGCRCMPGTPVYPCGACSYTALSDMLDAEMTIPGSQRCKFGYFDMKLRLTDANGTATELPLNPSTMNTSGSLHGHYPNNIEVRRAEIVWSGYADAAKTRKETGCGQSLQVR